MMLTTLSLPRALGLHDSFGLPQPHISAMGIELSDEEAEGLRPAAEGHR
jgi:hypothetical protein